MILLAAALVTALGVPGPQNKNKRGKAPKPPNSAAGSETFLKYCASCHGKTANGDGPAAFALRTTPPDLTTLSRRHENKFPAGYVGAVLTFGRSFASHGSEDMPIWGLSLQTAIPNAPNEHSKKRRQIVSLHSLSFVPYSWSRRCNLSKPVWQAEVAFRISA